MARLVILDASPLWLATMPSTKPAAAPLHAWLTAIEATGAIVFIPAVADYEVRRELVRRGASARLRNLNGLNVRLARLPISDAAWYLAADLWARVRTAGGPTASNDSLDADAIIAGQALTVGQPGDTVTVATSNVRHMTRFPGLDARDWPTIT